MQGLHCHSPAARVLKAPRDKACRLCNQKAFAMAHGTMTSAPCCAPSPALLDRKRSSVCTDRYAVPASLLPAAQGCCPRLGTRMAARMHPQPGFWKRHLYSPVLCRRHLNSRGGEWAQAKQKGTFGVAPALPAPHCYHGTGSSTLKNIPPFSPRSSPLSTPKVWMLISRLVADPQQGWEPWSSSCCTTK